MHPNAALIHRFYDSFAALDAAGMRACYHPDVVFSDPAFGELRGAEAGAMWAMLCARATDLRVSASDVQADNRRGRAHWEAHYTFGQTGRPVHNRIDAEFEFRDGLIIRHADRFGFWAWTRQALGPAGLLLGWTPIIRNRVRSTARRGLDKYMREHGEGAAAPAKPAIEAGALPTPLSDLMARVLEEPSEQAWAAFHDAFMRAPVGVIASEVPEGDGGPGAGEVRTGLARAAAPDGRVMVLACADRDAFARNFHDRFNREVLGRELARVVLAIPDCEGILVNSAASFNSLAIDRDQIPGLLERYEAA